MIGDRIVHRKGVTTYYLDDAEVTERQYRKRYPLREEKGPSSFVTFKPMHSEALCVHPDQRDEAIADAKAKGVPVDFDQEGRPVFTSSRQFRDYAKIYGFRHKGY